MSTAASQDVTDQVKQAAGENADKVTSATVTNPGRVDLMTTTVDPRGDDGSPEARQVIEICEAAQEDGAYTHVSVAENDGTTFGLYGHPTYGNTCTEV